MRQETIIKTYLKFDELTDEQKNIVVKSLFDINVDHPWYDFLIDEYTDKLKKLGFSDIYIEFSGFYNQGDGARFSAKHKRGNVYTVGSYSHSNSMRCDESPVLLEVAKRIAFRLYKELLEEYEYRTSEDCIVDTIRANQYEFDSETLKIV